MGGDTDLDYLTKKTTYYKILCLINNIYELFENLTDSLVFDVSSQSDEINYYLNENEELIHKIESKAEEIIREDLLNPKTTFAILKTDITETLHPFINNLTGRKPIILPIILDIKRDNPE